MGGDVSRCDWKNRRQQIVFWRRRQAGIVDLINSLGGLRGVAAVIPDNSTVAIRENARLIVELLHIAQEVSFGHTALIFNGGEDWMYFVQFSAIRDSPEIYVEAVGNKHLDDKYQLDQHRITALRLCPPLGRISRAGAGRYEIIEKAD